MTTYSDESLSTAALSLCPFPGRISPHAEAAEERLRAHLSRCGILRAAPTTEYYETSRLGHLVAQVYPDARPDRLMVLAEWYGTWTVFDDQLEKLADSRPPESLAAVTEAMLSWLPFSGPAPGLGDPGQATVPFAAGFGIAWTGIRAVMSAHWRRRFLGHTRDYLDGCRWEAANRRRRVVPGLDEYVTHRRRFGGIQMAMDLAEYGRGYELTPTLHASPLVQELLDVLGDIALWGNDVISVAVDHEEGNVSNLVFVLRRERGGTVAAAVEAASAMVRSRLERLDAIEAALPAWAETHGVGARQQRHLGYHLAGVRSWISGNIAWSRSNSRYRTTRPRVGGGQPNFLDALPGVPNPGTGTRDQPVG